MSLGSRLKKAESVITEIGCDDESYIRAYMSYYRGDGGKELEKLPLFKKSPEAKAEFCINALSRIDNDERKNRELGTR
jgi:hypothetical protein